jgi:hypothetical protein
MSEVVSKEGDFSSNQQEKEYLITEIIRRKLSQKGSFWNRQFPTLFGLLILLGGLVGGIFLIREERTIRGRTIETVVPREIKVTNLSENSFTVSWISDVPTSGFVALGKTSNLDETFLEDRDIWDKGIENYYTHHVTVTNLEASTTYYFKVSSDEKLFGQDDSPFKVTTATPSLSSPVSDPAYGQILKDDGTPAEGTVVYLKTSNCTTLSSLVRASGNWLIPLNLSRTEDLADFCQYSKRGAKIEIFAQGGPSGESRATVLTGLEKPVPNITLGQDYSFEDFSLLEPLNTSGETIPPSKGTQGDLNNDGVINTNDLSILRFNWGTSPKDAAADLNNDGVVNEEDLEILQRNWSQ